MTPAIGAASSELSKALLGARTGDAPADATASGQSRAVYPTEEWLTPRQRVMRGAVAAGIMLASIAGLSLLFYYPVTYYHTVPTQWTWTGQVGVGASEDNAGTEREAYERRHDFGENTSIAVDDVLQLVYTAFSKTAWAALLAVVLFLCFIGEFDEQSLMRMRSADGINLSTACIYCRVARRVPLLRRIRWPDSVADVPADL
jgi:hypothetical protein